MPVGAPDKLPITILASLTSIPISFVFDARAILVEVAVRPLNGKSTPDFVFTSDVPPADDAVFASPSPPPLSPQGILAFAVDAMGELESYHFEMLIQMTVDVSNDSALGSQGWFTSLLLKVTVIACPAAVRP